MTISLHPFLFLLTLISIFDHWSFLYLIAIYIKKDQQSIQFLTIGHFLFLYFQHPKSCQNFQIHVLYIVSELDTDVLTFHAEALDNDVRAISALCAHIRERGVLAGVSVKPGTPADFLLPLLDQMDLVLVMSVEPGFGGQAFQPQTLEKVRLLRSEIEARGLHTRIEIDGGINAQSGALAVEAGCDTLVAGSYVFKNDILQAVESLICL